MRAVVSHGLAFLAGSAWVLLLAYVDRAARRDVADHLARMREAEGDESEIEGTIEITVRTLSPDDGKDVAERVMREMVQRAQYIDGRFSNN